MIKYQASVVIPTYNRIDELRLTLSSLQKQVCRYKFEVIVADDGSSDDTKSVVEEFIDTLDIRYCFQSDKGFRAAAARNMGIQLALGDICVFIDNGIILHSKAIESHIKSHHNSEVPCVVIGYVYGFQSAIEEPEEVKRIVDINTPDKAIEIMDKKGFFDAREEYYRELGEDLHMWPAPFVICWTCNISIPKKTVIEIGMFDEWFTSWGGEDNDLGLALQKNNIKFVLSRDAKSIHYPHEKESLGDWKNNREAAVAQIVRIKEYLLLKHPIPAMKKWMTVYRPIELNKSLMER